MACAAASVVLPLVAALAAAVKDRGWLVARPNLDLHEVGALAPTAAHVWALH